MPAQNHIELIAKAMSVIEVLAETDKPVDLQELTNRVGLVKSSVFRILFTLRELGYVEQHGRGRYSLTMKVCGLGKAHLAHASLTDLVHPHLERLRAATNESAWLAQWLGRKAVIVDVAEASQQRLRLSLAVGDKCPLHASSLGKSIAAWLRPDELARVLGDRELRRFTPHTTCERTTLLRELAQVRERGYATNDQETVEGAFVAGAPVFDTRGRVFAAVSVSTPTARCTAAKRESLIEAVRQAGAEITRELTSLAYEA